MFMEINYEAIGRRIRALRKKKNWTQDELRDRAEISKTHMSHIETGTTKVSLPALVALANALDTTVDSLLCDSVKCSECIFEKDIEAAIKDCSAYELSVIVEAIEYLKRLLRNNKAED